MVQKDYSKQFKYGLGEKTLNTAIELFEYIQLANMFKENRKVHLNGFIIKFETVKTLLRVAEDITKAYIDNVYKVKITTNGNRSSSIN